MPSVTKYPLLLLAVLWLLTVGAFGGGYHWQTRSADAIRAEAAQAHEITLMKMAPLSQSVCRAEILVRQTAPVKNSH